MSETNQDDASQATENTPSLGPKPTVASLAVAHDDNVSRIGTLESKVEDLFAKVAPIVQSGVFGAPAAEGATLVQDIVNFLHHLFPGHAGLPGTPSAPVATPPVGVHT